MKYDIFISYRRSDRELVAHIVRKLEERGAAVWYDAEIEGGADWREIIVEALSSSDMLVIFFSEACNQSRQLKKELAIADNMEKPVVPILIENTKPKGAYLYELADRNWLQAFPDPMSHAGHIVDHLIALAEKSPGGLEGIAAGRTPDDLMPKKAAPSPGGPAPEEAAAAEPLRKAESAPPVHDDLFKSKMGAPAAPRAEDYIGKKSKAAKRAEHLNDILPFKWIDLLFLIPLGGAFTWFMLDTGMDAGDTLASEILGMGIFLVAMVGLYGALVFPFRYYMRRRRPLHALSRYILSSLILYAVVVGTFVVGDMIGLFPYDEPGEIALVFGVIWLVFMVVAFIIYAVLATQRAVRAFRSNIKKI